MNTALQLEDGKLELHKLPIPKVSNPNDCVIKISFSGICGTDLRIVAGDYPAAKKVVLGHEFTGIVTEIGSDVKHLKIGDRVCVNPTNWCGTCYYCTRGNPQFCVKEAMHTAHGFHKDGGFEEYCLVASNLCYLLPPTISLKQAIFCQPISDIARGWDNMQHYESDAKILVCGAGMIGLLWASMFHYHGYREVTITEPTEARREMAAKLHMGYRCIRPREMKEEAVVAIANQDETWGFDVVVDCTGNPRAVENQLKWLRKGATIVLFGVCPKGAVVNFEPFQVYAKEIRVVHSFLNKFTFPKTIKMVDDMSKRYLDWDAFQMKTYSLNDYEDAFAAMEKGDISKAVFAF
eukprot:gene12180-13437_t